VRYQWQLYSCWRRCLSSEGRLACELELRALASPLELLDAILQAFAAKKEETLQARSDFHALLQADARRLVKDRIEPDLAAVKQALPPLPQDHRDVPGPVLAVVGAEDQRGENHPPKRDVLPQGGQGLDPPRAPFEFAIIDSLVGVIYVIATLCLVVVW
jgi:hypothetical protein